MLEAEGPQTRRPIAGLANLGASPALADEDSLKLTPDIIRLPPQWIPIDLGGASIAGLVEIAEVNGPSTHATNSFESPRTVDVKERRAERAGPRPAIGSPRTLSAFCDSRSPVAASGEAFGRSSERTILLIGGAIERG